MRNHYCTLAALFALPALLIGCNTTFDAARSLTFDSTRPVLAAGDAVAGSVMLAGGFDTIEGMPPFYLAADRDLYAVPMTVTGPVTSVTIGFE